MCGVVDVGGGSEARSAVYDFRLMGMKMAKRTMLLREWMLLCAELGSQNRLEELDVIGGPSPGGAAAELEVSRQRIHQLIAEGKLDVIELRETAWALPHVVMITSASLRRWKSSRPGKQQELPLTPNKATSRLRLRRAKRD